MKLIKQSYEILGTPKSLYEAWEFVAKAARNCYQSQKSKPDETEEQFCKRLLLKNEDMECNHMSPFEFGILYLTIDGLTGGSFDFMASRYENNPYSRIKWIGAKAYITTNLRVIFENGWEDDLKYAGPPTKHHVKACCFRMITNLGILAEIRTHESALSFTAESTRFCNYNKDKFGNELTFILPCWAAEHETPDNWENCSLEFRLLYQELLNIEGVYLNLVRQGWTPQQAATILPKALKTTVMMCGYEDNLRHVFRLRAEECSGPVHPQMKELMVPMYKDYLQYMYGTGSNS